MKGDSLSAIRINYICLSLCSRLFGKNAIFQIDAMIGKHRNFIGMRYGDNRFIIPLRQHLKQLNDFLLRFRIQITGWLIRKNQIFIFGNRTGNGNSLRSAFVCTIPTMFNKA